MVLDPELADELAAGEGPPLRELPLPEFRAEAERAMLDGQGAPWPIDRVEDVLVPGPEPLPCTIYRPRGIEARSPALLFFHGGGWVIGSRASHDPMCRALANLAQVVVVSPEYRRAPEARFPTAVDDATVATRWLMRHAAEMELDPNRIGVAGDSAGGNLAAVVARRMRDEGASLALQLLAYPVASVEHSTDSYREFAHGYGLTAEDMAWFWAQYLGPGSDGRSPDASPLLVDDLRGLPPAVIMTAAYDVLRDEGERYADRLVQAGVPTVRIRALGMPHAFLNYLARSRGVRDLYAAAAALVANTL